MLLPKKALELIWLFAPLERATDVAFREVVDHRFARIALTDKKAAAARRRAEEEQEDVRLLDSCHGDGGGVDETVSISSADSVSSDAQSKVSWNHASSRVWRADGMRPQQHKAVKMIAEDEECDGKLLLVDCTGGAHIREQMRHRAREGRGGRCAG